MYYLATHLHIMYVHTMSCFITGVPRMVPNVTVNNSTNGNILTIILSWGEPFNNLDPIVNYAVSCSGDVTCPPNFTTTDNTTRSYTITNLTPNAHYIFSVVATNSIGSGEAGVVVIGTPPSTTATTAIASRVDTTIITSTESVTDSMPSQSMGATTSSIEISPTTTISSKSINTVNHNYYGIRLALQRLVMFAYFIQNPDS